MKITALVFSALLAIPFLSNAQAPTITSANNFQSGEVSIQHSADPTGVAPGASGANVTWNFSKLSPMVPADSTVNRYINVSATPFAKMFSGTDIASYDPSDDSTIQYYSYKNNQLALAGVASYFADPTSPSGLDTLEILFAKPEVLYAYPLTYQTSQKTNYQADFSFFGSTNYIRGNVTTNADGYGTLLILGKTYTNVLRVFDQAVEVDSSPGTPNTISNTSSWYYLMAGKKDPILSITVSDDGSGNGPDTTVTYNIDTKTLGIPNNTNALAEGLVMFPNPAHSICNLTFTSEANAQADISIMDGLGREVRSIHNQVIVSGANSIDLDIKGLTKGLYFVRMSAGQYTQMEKLLVE